jgi:hypothetical protein
MNSTRYIGVFDEDETFEKAVQRLKDLNVQIEEIYMPIPLHHAVKNVAGSSKLPMVAYFLGISSVIATLAFLYYAAVISWPLNIGGKPSNAFPSFIVVTLVVTILSVTILSLLAFSISANLYPGKKTVVFDNRAMDDKFIIVLNSDKVSDSENKLKQTGANEVIQMD